MGFVLVRLNGGPRDGSFVKYSTPLPNTLVFAQLNDEKTGLSYVDYERRNGLTEYDWVRNNSATKTKGNTNEATNGPGEQLNV